MSLSLKNWLDCVNYRITEGGEYGWRCFGPHAYSLSTWDGRQDGYSANVIFDTETQEVYSVEVCDYNKNNAYRYINPTYKQKYQDEAVSNKVDDMAWDEVKWTDLEVYEDWQEKASAIASGRDYDTDVMIPLDLPKDELYNLMLEAHKRNITLNQLVEKILTAVIDKHKDAQSS